MEPEAPGCDIWRKESYRESEERGKRGALEVESTKKSKEIRSFMEKNAEEGKTLKKRYNESFLVGKWKESDNEWLGVFGDKYLKW